MEALIAALRRDIVRYKEDGVKYLRGQRGAYWVNQQGCKVAYDVGDGCVRALGMADVVLVYDDAAEDDADAGVDQLRFAACKGWSYLECSGIQLC